MQGQSSYLRQKIEYSSTIEIISELKFAIEMALLKKLRSKMLAQFRYSTNAVLTEQRDVSTEIVKKSAHPKVSFELWLYGRNFIHFEDAPLSNHSTNVLNLFETSQIFNCYLSHSPAQYIANVFNDFIFLIPHSDGSTDDLNKARKHVYVSFLIFHPFQPLRS